ncbi:hypothetical protein B0H15DRAFT_780556, partial [Mycena belliarum]
MADHNQAGSHLSRRCTIPFINVLLGEKIPRPDRGAAERNRWCRAMLILFKPWRTLNDLKSPEILWTAAFDATVFTPESMAIMANLNVENECKDARDKYEELRK